MTEALKYCLVVPHFNHSRELSGFLPRLLEHHLDCIVVDDGSEPGEVAELERLLESEPLCHLVRRNRNGGKGAAVISGAEFARNLDATHIIQIDADGQHNSADVSNFITASRQVPDTIICGNPVFDTSAPKARLYGRKITDFWAALETLSLKIKDGLCGFRVYPLQQLEKLLARYSVGKRMDFDTEILVKAVWDDVPLQFIDTPVSYLHQGSSHFHYLRDNLTLVSLHGRLMFGMLVRSPMLIYRQVRQAVAGS